MISECELHDGRLDKHGYGIVGGKGPLRLAHRRRFFEVFGWLPPVVRHTCDNPTCISPWHLVPGSHSSNMADMAARGRARNQNTGATHCRHGHEFTPENTYVAKDGRRACRTCGRERHRAAYVVVGAR